MPTLQNRNKHFETLRALLLRSTLKRSAHHVVFFNVSDIRLQLNEQLRCLDMRMEAQVALVTELQDFFRRRGELELDYSKNLDKLAKTLQLRHKEQKQKYLKKLSLQASF